MKLHVVCSITARWPGHISRQKFCNKISPFLENINHEGKIIHNYIKILLGSVNNYRMPVKKKIFQWDARRRSFVMVIYASRYIHISTISHQTFTKISLLRYKKTYLLQNIDNQYKDLRNMRGFLLSGRATRPFTSDDAIL